MTLLKNNLSDDDVDDHFHDQCGVFGIWNSCEASQNTYLALHSLQHRGQESAGIVSSDSKQFFVHKNLGLVQEVFNKDVLSNLLGDNAIGHVRYSTSGDSSISNAQPLSIECNFGALAIAHNGNLTNSEEIKDRLEQDGSIFQTTSDTEVILHLFAKEKSSDLIERTTNTLRQIKGAFSLVILTKNELIAVRDPFGFRPLVFGKLDDAYLFASEQVAFELIGATYIRDIEPGEMVIVNDNGIKSIRPFDTAPKKMCVFEYIYFARPDSNINNINVYEARKKMGKALAQEANITADIVIPVPDSGLAAALGFSEESGIPFDFGLVRSNYIGRTFIESKPETRQSRVRLKLSPNRSVVKDKIIVVVDDSIVRGTTSNKIIKMLREAGAAKIHLCISSPPIYWPCFYGIDTPSQEDLVACKYTKEEIANFISADSLTYLSIEAIYKALGGNEYCDACFTGNYPVPIPVKKQQKKYQLKVI